MDNKTLADTIRQAMKEAKKKDRDDLLASIADTLDPSNPVPVTELPEWEVVQTALGKIAISPNGMLYKEWGREQGVKVRGVLHPWS